MPAVFIDVQNVSRKRELAGKPKRFQAFNKRFDDIAPQRDDGFAAQRKAVVMIIIKSPADKRQRHTHRLATAHRAVTDDGIAGSIRAWRRPPCQRCQLFLRKQLKLNDPSIPFCPIFDNHFTRIPLQNRLAFETAVSCPDASAKRCGVPCIVNSDGFAALQVKLVV